MQIIIIQNFITGIKVPVELWTAKIALLPIIQSTHAYQTTLELATERTTLDFDLREDKIYEQISYKQQERQA